MKDLPLTSFPDIAPAMQAAAEKVWRESSGEEPLLRASLIIPRVSPLDWLSRLPDELRFYGSTRDKAQPLEIGGLGIADEALWKSPVTYDEVFARLNGTLATASAGLRYYGGFRFDQQQSADTDWQSFGCARFVIPRFELVSNPQASQLSLHLTPHEAESGWIESACAQLTAMSFDPWQWQDRFPLPLQRHDAPDQEGWRRNVELALHDFATDHLKKVVLARKATFHFEGHVDPITLLHRLKSATPECYHFCYMPSGQLAFVGASPERLYKREEGIIETEAVAGTRMRGVDQEDDLVKGQELLSNPKDQLEHGMVREGLKESLSPLCEKIEMDPAPSLLKLARGQHLYSAVKGRLKDGTGDAAILGALHPTPALGGRPTLAALERIAEWEPFDRGWYAGPVGWVSRHAAEFAVAIRCGLVQPERLSLFSGAGLVEGSTAENEWEEIELKIRDFIKVLTGA
jgi:menaquinone-specific isochorismate synthase